MNKMHPEPEPTLLRAVIRKSMNDTDAVDQFFRGMERICQLGNSSDRTLTTVTLDSIEQRWRMADEMVVNYILQVYPELR